MTPDPLHDVAEFLTRSSWTVVPFWLLLLGSLWIAGVAWRRSAEQRTVRHVAVWLLRLSVGAMWWQQSLWKIPPDYGALIHWMQQMVDHASVALQSTLVRNAVLPHIGLFGPAVYLIEVAIGASLMVGLFTRLGAALGALMAINLWLGLYSAPGEWPWTYFFLVVIQLLFVIDPPGFSLGADALLNRRTSFNSAATGRAVA